MRGEESPHKICGRNVVAADAQAGPHVVASLNGIKCDGCGILTARINVGMYLGSFGMLRSE
jgi:hypothetical protein